MKIHIKNSKHLQRTEYWKITKIEMKITIIYKTDNQHSFKSRDVIGVSRNIDELTSLICQQVNKEGGSLYLEQWELLANTNQTQGYKGDGEFVVEEIEIGTLI